jgi:hypothetical protein
VCNVKWARLADSLVVAAILASACAPPHSVQRSVELAGDASQPIGKRAADGARCLADSECSSSHCVDGVCCQSLCAGLCLACDKPGSEGQCLPVAEGQDPDEECAEDPVATCRRDGVCDGQGGCRRYRPGTECESGSCMNGIERAASTCNGNGVCEQGGARSCGLASCIGNSCGAPCGFTADCQTGFFCDRGTCRTKRDQGAACETAEQCSSGNCADRVCCATACTDRCYVCNRMGSVGTCTAVSDMLDPRRECPVQNLETCGNAGGCNGRGACRQHLAGTQCGFGSCSGFTLSGLPTCDGLGRCQPGPPSDCAPFVCNGRVCWNVCADDAQCKPPARCMANNCR